MGWGVEPIHQTAFIPNRHVRAPYPTRPLFALSAEQLQVDFVEMLRVRGEKRRQRHVEVLQRQKQEEEEGELGEESEGRGRTQEVKDGEPGDEVFSPSSKPQSPRAAASRSPDSRRTDTTQTQVGGEVNRLNRFV